MSQLRGPGYYTSDNVRILDQTKVTRGEVMACPICDSKVWEVKRTYSAKIDGVPCTKRLRRCRNGHISTSIELTLINMNKLPVTSPLATEVALEKLRLVKQIVDFEYE